MPKCACFGSRGPVLSVPLQMSLGPGVCESRPRSLLQILREKGKIRLAFFSRHSAPAWHLNSRPRSRLCCRKKQIKLALLPTPKHYLHPRVRTTSLPNTTTLINQHHHGYPRPSSSPCRWDDPHHDLSGIPEDAGEPSPGGCYSSALHPA